MATTGAYVFYILHDDVLHLPAVPTALLCVFVVGPVLGLGLEAMARRLADASATMKVVATIGLVLVVQGFFSATFGTLARTFPAWLPQRAFDIGGVFVGEDQMIITGIALAATVALFLFFRRTRLGLAMRGVVDNPELLDLGGTSPATVRRDGPGSSGPASPPWPGSCWRRASTWTPPCSRCWSSRPSAPRRSAGSPAFRSPTPAAWWSASSPRSRPSTWSPAAPRWPGCLPVSRLSCSSWC